MKNEKGVVEVPHFTEEDIPELLKYAEAKLQKIHDKYIKQIDDMLAEKDKEIMTV